jgi:hypothetical protein
MKYTKSQKLGPTEHSEHTEEKEPK